MLAVGHVYSANVAERLHRSSSITVRVQTLSDYLVAGRAVDLLKIDAEGAELDVLGIGIAALDETENSPMFAPTSATSGRLGRLVMS